MQTQVCCTKQNIFVLNLELLGENCDFSLFICGIGQLLPYGTNMHITKPQFLFHKVNAVVPKHPPCYFLSLAVDYCDMFVFLKSFNFVIYKLRCT